MRTRRTHIAKAIWLLAAAHALPASLPWLMPAACAQTTADANAAAGRKPKVETAANGATVVHISPANSAGVSHNLFTQFNVGAAGMVLNNSAAPIAAPPPVVPPVVAPVTPPVVAPIVAPPPVQPIRPPAKPICRVRFCSALQREGPDAQALTTTPSISAVGQASVAAVSSGAESTTTSNLANAPGGNILFGGNTAAQARLIVNEVNSSSATTLSGLMEVYGQGADVVVANPNGITCNGCGFVNTQRASLVSGAPTWSGAALSGFSVAGGNLSIGAAGLNGSGLASLDLVAGRLSIDGKVDLPAGNSAIYAVLGPNAVDYSTLAATAQGRTDTKPTYALDLSASGSLYANQIYLLANEQGPGVNVSGWAEARSGGLTLDAAGNLSLSGVVKTSVTSSAVALNAAQISVNDGTVNSAGLALVQASQGVNWVQGLALGSDVMLGSAGDMLLNNPRVISTGDARLSSAANLTLKAGDIKTAGNVSLLAAQDLTLVPTQATGTVTEGSTTREITRYTRSQIDAVGSVALQANRGVVTLDGPQISAGGSMAIQGLGVAMLARKDLTKETTVLGSTTYAPSTENLVQARLLAGGDIAVLATGGTDATGVEQGKIFMTGAMLESNEGHISLLAAKDVDITHDITTDRNYERLYEVKRSWFSKKITEHIKSSSDENANPSEISGRSVSIGAGGNLNLVGSSVEADGALGLHADSDLNLLATQEAGFAYESRSVRRSGIYSSGGLSITIGNKSSTSITDSQGTRQSSTSLRSIAGDVMATAGGQYLQLSSDITAPLGDIHVAAQNITLQSNNNTRSTLNMVRERQSGFTLALNHPLVSALQTASEMAKVAKRTESGRFQALALLTSGLSIYNQYRPLNELTKSLTSGASDAATPGWTISLSLGASRSDFESLTSSSTPVESSINAGRNASLTATGTAADTGDINLVGSRVIASENITLKAQRDITMAAAVGKETENTKRTSSSASIGLSYGFSGTAAGLSLNIAASRSNAWSNGWGTTFFNSELTAGQQLTVDSGRDWTLSGAKATGQTVVAHVGSAGAGNLSLISPRDESFYQAREQSFGFGISIPLAGAGGSVSLNASQMKLLAENESVKQQSAIVAGTGGYQIAVNGHTHLVGAAIASKADAARNTLATQTLVHEDVVNRDAVSGKSTSIGLSLSSSGTAGSSIGFARIDSNETSNTRSSVASPVTITRPDLQATKAQRLKNVDRDPLAGQRSAAQTQLNHLLWNEPPQCDTCEIQSVPTGLNAAANKAKLPTASTQVESTATAGVGEVTISGTNSAWSAWRAAVDALTSQIAALDVRIAAIDARPYQTLDTLSQSPSGLHQPLLHTFDKTNATQALRDGVAVTAAFGKAAYKASGDFAVAKEKAAKTACNGAAYCPEADKWKDGGIYRTALHMAIGSMAYGTPGATGNLAGSLALNAMDKVLAELKISDPTAANLLKNLVVTVAGAAAGSTAGAAAAFNADANNRQLHPDEKARLKSLANGDPHKEQRLSAAACYLVRCSGEFPVGSEAWHALVGLERVGALLTTELDQLRQQSSPNGALFTYSYWANAKDDFKRLNNQYSILTKLGGGLQVGAGAATTLAGSTIAATGAATCAPTAGTGCAAAAGGALLALWGQDQIMAGTRAIATGTPQFTLGARLISEVTGISVEQLNFGTHCLGW